MANTLYDSARERFLKGELNWMTDTIKVILVDTGSYTPAFGTHANLADIGPAARISSAPVTLVDKTTSGGAADARDATFPSVSGPSIEAIVIYKEGADEASSPLIAFIDTGTGLPITPNGGDIIVTWDNGPNKIFKV